MASLGTRKWLSFQAWELRLCRAEMESQEGMQMSCHLHMTPMDDLLFVDTLTGTLSWGLWVSKKIPSNGIRDA